jgi:hypothetical protein
MELLALKFGRRGLVLLSVGLALSLYGGSQLILPPRERFSRIGPSPLDWTDSHYWWWVWLTCGLIAIGFGIRPRTKRDALGFLCAFIPPALWTFFYLYSFLVFSATGGEYGEPNTWAGAIIWADFAFLIRVCAGWDDTPEPLIIPGDDLSES